MSDEREPALLDSIQHPQQPLRDVEYGPVCTEPLLVLFVRSIFWLMAVFLLLAK
jgi:hypothetical protein